MKLETLVARFHGRCVYCGVNVHVRPGKPLPDTATQDHFIPRSKGGHGGKGNLVLACNACNQAKGDLDPRMLLFVWLWLDAQSFHDAIVRFEKHQRPALDTVH